MAALQGARAWVASIPPGEPGERRAALLEVARLAWRAGRVREALAQLARARPLLRSPDAAPERIAWNLLRASVAVEQGKLKRARLALLAARASAESLGDDDALARVLRRLGTLDARTGRAAQAGAAYRAALAALRRSGREDGLLEGALLANLATMETWLGRHEEAARLYDGALALRRGLAIEQLNTRAARALLDVARGGNPGAFPALAAEAEALGDARLRAELLAYAAEELLGAGDLGGAERAVDRARVALADLGGAEALLDPLVDAADAALAAARGDVTALELFASAVRAFERVEAAFFAARTARNAALAAAMLGLDDEIVGWMARVARLCDPGRLRLGGDARFAVPYALAALDGDGATRRHAERVLARMGRARARAHLRAAGRDDLALRLDQEAPPPRPRGAFWRVDGPDGVVWLTRPMLQLFNAAHDGRIVLDHDSGELRLGDGSRRSIARHHVLAPLLAHLAARSPSACTVEELARVVWERRPSASLRVAIKMAIVRLRQVFGPARGLIRTVRAADGLAYALDESARVHVLRRVQASVT